MEVEATANDVPNGNYIDLKKYDAYILYFITSFATCIDKFLI